MERHNHEQVVGVLRYLTDKDLQLRLWTSDGSSGEWSSFDEFACMLFDDTGLTFALDEGRTGYSTAAETSLRKLCEAISRVPNLDPELQVDHPNMVRVRELAATALREVEASLSSS